MSWIRALPGFVLGVFLARILGEAAGLPGLWAAILLSSALGLGIGWLLSRFPLSETWPALILSAYLVYPEVLPELAKTVVGITLIAFSINVTLSSDRPKKADTPKADTPKSTAGWAKGAIFIGLVLIFFALYFATLAPDVLPADSGELQVVAAQLGVAHPPGFPLYVMLAHLITRLLPMLPVAYAVNLFSAMTSALTIGIVFLAGVLITRRWFASLVAAIALGSATTFWSQATTANVRSLTGLFAALILYALLRFRIATNNQDSPSADRWLVVTALFMGFGLTHHVSLLFLILVGLVFILLVDRRLIRQPRRWWRPIGAALLGLLPLLYLPMRAGADVRGATPDLATISGFLEHVLATGFRGDLFYYTTSGELWLRLGVMLNVMTFQFSLILLVGMLVRLIILIARDRPLAWLLGGGFVVYLIVAATYRAPQTVEYMLPAYIPAALMLAYALGWLLDWTEHAPPFSKAAAILITALLTVATLVQLPRHISAAGAYHEANSAREYAARLLAEAPAGSVIMAHWHWATPLWYLQEVEGQRPDVYVRFVYPEGESYEATWERRTRDAFADGRPVITTYVPPVPYLDFPIPEPAGEALLYPQERRTSLPPGFIPANSALGETISVLGYRLETDNIEPGEAAVLEVAWRPLAEIDPGTSLFVHLLDTGGQLVGQDDRQAVAADGLTISQFRITPRLSASIGMATLLIGATSPAAQAGETGDSREELAQIELIENHNRPYTRNQVYRATVESQPETLIGYDRDRTLPDRVRLFLHWQTGLGTYRTDVFDHATIDTLSLPAYRGPWGVAVDTWSFPRERGGTHYVPFGQGIVWTGEAMTEINPLPDETITLNQIFQSTQALNRDYVVSARLIGLEPDGYHWAWWDLQDSIPAMGAIPTLKWIDGSEVRSPHQFTVSSGATPGQALTGALTLYDAFTNRPLPILDERITNQNPWVPLGTENVGQ